MKYIILLSFFLSAVSGAEVEKKSENPFSFMPFKAANEEYTQYRDRWHRLTGFELSGLHWNQFISIYINQDKAVYKNNYSEYLKYYIDFEDYEDDDDFDEPLFEQYSPGTILLKENFTSHTGRPGDAMFLTVMKKHAPGFAPEGGDWEYLQFDTAGNTMVQGSAEDPTVDVLCASCHHNVADRDFIFSTFYSYPVNR